jgi:sugar O-acyltransferase (sialic acid O-acetyltransferase NeuD family)
MFSEARPGRTRSTERHERTRKVVLFGNAAVATALYVQLTHDSEYDVVGFTVDREYLKEDRLLGLPVVPFDQVVNFYPPDRHHMIVAVGFVQVNRLRAERCLMAKKMGFRLLSYVSSKATTWPDLVIGENCMIASNCVINPLAEIGDNVYIGPGSIIGHHTLIKDHCFVASGVVIAGKVTVEPYSFLGVGSVIRNRVTIASGSVIGAGSVLLEDTRENGVYMASSAEALPISSDRLPIR